MLLPDKFTAHYLSSYNFEIATLIDIGVGNGTPSLYSLFQNRKIVLIDPQPDTAKLCAAWLEDKSFDMTLLNFAAGQHAGKLELTLCGNKSSLLNRLGDIKTVGARKEIVEVRTLDDMVAGNGIKGPFGIKIDTEGYELSVIRGAAETLKNTKFVIAEVSVKHRFEDGYRFSEFVGEMARLGFEVADILHVPSHSRRCDLLFTPARPASPPPPF